MMFDRFLESFAIAIAVGLLPLGLACLADGALLLGRSWPRTREAERPIGATLLVDLPSARRERAPAWTASMRDVRHT